MNRILLNKQSLPLQLILISLFYAVVFLFYTWPLITNFSSHVPGKEGSDVYSFLWNSYLANSNFLDFISFETEKLFAPHGTSLIAHTLTPLMSIFTLLFKNTAFGINIFLALNFIFSGLGGYLLSRRYIKSIILCLLVGFIFAYSPWKTARLMEHYNLVLTATVPFYMLFFIRAFDLEGKNLVNIKSRRDLFLCALMGIISLLCDPLIAALLFFFTLFYLAWFKIPFLKNFDLSLKKLVILTGVIIAGHFAIDFLQSILQDKGAFWWGADFMNLIIPWHHLYVSNIFSESFIKLIHTRGLESVTFLGFTLVILLLSILIWGRKYRFPKEVKALFGIGLIFTLLTMPQVKIADQVLFNNPLSIIHFIPGLNNFRCPGRFIMPAYLLLSIGIFYKLEKFSIQKLYPLIFFLFIIEYCPAQIKTLNTQKIPKAYQELKTLKGKNLLPIPFGIRDGYKAMGHVKVQDMWYQSVHHKNLTGGYISRVDEEIWDFYRQDTIMKTLLKAQTDTGIQIPEFSREKVNSFFNTYKPDIILISPGYKHSKAARLLTKISKGRIQKQKTVNNYLILALKR